MRQGRSAEGLSLLGGAAEAPRIEDKPGWRLKLLRAELLVDLEKVSDARDLLALTAVPPRGLAPRWEKIQGDIARLLHQPADADLHYARALSEGGADADLVSETLWKREILFATTHREPDAEAVGRSLIARATSLSQPRWRGGARMTLGYLALRRKAWSRCVALADQAIEDFHTAGAEALRSRVLVTRGVCTYQLGLFENARIFLNAAIEAQQRLGLNIALPASVGALGSCYVTAGESQTALPYMKRALDLALQYRPEEAPMRATNLAQTYVELKDWTRARPVNDLAMRLAREHDDQWGLHNSKNSAALIARGLGDFALAERLFRELLAETPEGEDIIKLEARLATVCASVHRQAEAASLFDRARRDLETVTAGLPRQDRIAFGQRFVDVYYENVEWLIGQRQTKEALSLVEAWRATTLTGSDESRAKATALQTLAANRHQTFISYWLASPQSYAWVVTGSRIDMVALADQDDIDAQVRAYRDGIATSLRDPRTVDGAPARKLYDMLIAPLARFIPAQASVVIAADGTLHSLPFGALVAPSPAPHYWVEDATLTVAPSLTALPDADPPPVATPKTLVLGDARDGGDEFPPLGFAAAELATLSATFGTGALTTITGAEAHVASYVREASEHFSVIHLIAHAVPDKLSPLDSYFVLSGPDPARRLSVRTIMASPLDADLVTLSACHSAESTAYAGEGLIGLAWGFLSAGARYVVASMWDVPDRSTAELMDHFYAALKTGVSPPAALHKAQIALSRRPGSPGTPYHWAAFNVYAGPGPKPSAGVAAIPSSH